MVLGDGCLHYIKNNGNVYGGLTIDHGLEQSDYQSWKAKLLSDMFDRDVKMRTGHKGKSVQVSLCTKRFRAWRKFCYPSNKKDIAKILPFINNPEFAIAIWLMDDGYVEASLNPKYPTHLSAGFRLFTCDQSEETQTYIINWFKDKFNVECKVRQSFKRSTNKHYPFLKFKQQDSLVIWEKIREFVLQFKSMRHKFRYIEQVYQNKIIQRIPAKAEDIVST